MSSSTGALTDDPPDGIKRLRLIIAAHWFVGFLMPLSFWHVVSWNLPFTNSASAMARRLGT